MNSIFNNFPTETKCKICNTNKNGKTILVPIIGTEEGNNMQADPVHVDCILNNIYKINEYYIVK